jgi:hypothetical protein
MGGRRDVDILHFPRTKNRKCLTVEKPIRVTALMMEAANTSETSVNFYQTTRRNNLEDSHLHTRRRDNLRSPITDNIRTDRRTDTNKLKYSRCETPLKVRAVCGHVSLCFCRVCPLIDPVTCCSDDG